MATLNYTRRLANLQNRRFDRELNESLLSKSFGTRVLPENIEYMVESMRPIDKKYNDKTIKAATNVQNHLAAGYDLPFSRAHRTQGSITTATNIRVYSDFDLLTIIDSYYYRDPNITNGPFESDYSGTPSDDLGELRKQTVKILKSIYDEVDDSGEKCVSIFNKSLNRKVDVVFGFWYHSKFFVETKNEHYLGIKFTPNQVLVDYPFAHINNVNHKGQVTSDGSRMAIRLLKTLKADCEDELKILKSFQITTIVHSIDNSLLDYLRGDEIRIAQVVSGKLNELIENPTYRKALKSPNGLETPLENDAVVADIKRLKQDLDELIEDSAKEILGSTAIKKAILNY